VAIDQGSIRSGHPRESRAAVDPRALMEASLDPLVTISPDGTITDVNRATVKATGVPRSRLIGSDFASYFTEPDRARAGYERVLAEGSVRDYPLRLRSVSGKLMDVEYNASVYRDAAGECLGVFASARDVTDRNRAERDLMESEARYWLVLENASDAIYVHEFSPTGPGHFIDANLRASKMLGYSREEFREMGVSAIDVPEHAARLPAIMAQLASTGSARFETEHLAKDGTRVPVEVGVGLFDMHGTPTVLSIVRDISERKHAEQAVAESERHFRETLEDVDLIAVILDADGRVTFCNDFLLQLTSWRREEVVGKDWFAIFPPETTRERDKRTFSATVESGRAPFRYESVIVTRYGGERLIGWNTPVLRDHQGKPMGVIYIGDDITERRHVEEQLRRIKAEADEANRALEGGLAREQQLARTDTLTGVSNRRHWFDLAEHEFDVAARYRHPLSVMMFDIDKFKLVNDAFGHAVGDRMLERIAQVASAELRSADVIGRYGGEEFVVALPMTTAQQAYPIAQRILAAVDAIRVKTPKGRAAVATLSIGIAEAVLGRPAEGADGNDSISHAVQRADDAMYAVKAAGRNGISIYGATPSA